MRRGRGPAGAAQRRRPHRPAAASGADAPPRRRGSPRRLAELADRHGVRVRRRLRRRRDAPSRVLVAGPAAPRPGRPPPGRRSGAGRPRAPGGRRRGRPRPGDAHEPRPRRATTGSTCCPGCCAGCAPLVGRTGGRASTSTGSRSPPPGWRRTPSTDGGRRRQRWSATAGCERRVRTSRTRAASWPTATTTTSAGTDRADSRRRGRRRRTRPRPARRRRSRTPVARRRRGHQLGDQRLHGGVLQAGRRAPDQHADQDEAQRAGEGQRRHGGDQERQHEQTAAAEPVVRPAGDQRGHRLGRHGAA